MSSDNLGTPMDGTPPAGKKKQSQEQLLKSAHERASKGQGDVAYTEMVNVIQDMKSEGSAPAVNTLEDLQEISRNSSVFPLIVDCRTTSGRTSKIDCSLTLEEFLVFQFYQGKRMEEWTLVLLRSNALFYDSKKQPSFKLSCSDNRGREACQVRDNQLKYHAGIKVAAFDLQGEGTLDALREIQKEEKRSGKFVNVQTQSKSRKFFGHR